MLKKVICVLPRNFSSSFLSTTKLIFSSSSSRNFNNRASILTSTTLYNYTKVRKIPATIKSTRISVEQEISELYKKLSFTAEFKQQYKKLISKCTSSGDLPSLIKLKEFRVQKNQEHNEENSQEHLLELYELATLYEAHKNQDKIQAYFKKVYHLLQKFPGLAQLNELNQIIEYMIGKHMFAGSLSKRSEAKEWYQRFKQKLEDPKIGLVNDDLRFYYHLELAAIYLDLGMQNQSKQQYQKFFKVVQKGTLQNIEKTTVLMALNQFAQLQFTKGDAKHALQVTDMLLSQINLKNSTEVQFLYMALQIVRGYGNNSQESKQRLDKIQSLVKKSKQLRSAK